MCSEITVNAKNALQWQKHTHGGICMTHHVNDA